MTTVTNCQSAATHLMSQALVELEEEDTKQASEKGWGAAAQAVKAVAEARGWEHRTHAALFIAVSRLARETGNVELDRLFGIASSLHGNFYENWLTENQVRVLLEDVGRFVRVMDGVE